MFMRKVSENLLLWITNGILLTLSLYIELFSVPAKRPFSLDDISISNPYVEFEKYSNTKLALVCGILPILLTSIIIVFDKKNNKFTRFYKAISCFVFSLSITVFITTFLKVRLAKLRPDFLARCAPDLSKISSTSKTIALYTEEICTYPYGHFILNDGYKSCPSGHSTVSVTGMLFFSLWFYNEYAKTNKNGIIKMLCFVPFLIALDVATSRIYDFKHGYYDIITGSIIGAFGAVLGVYNLDLFAEDDEDEFPYNSSILPV